MANYTKSFNFRNGVQVDDSNFIVNSVGLVGIGTTTPNEHLDVRGNIKVVGDSRITGYTSVTNIEVVGVMTVGAGITLDPSSGIITATKFIGDASGLTNIVAIATDGFIANVGSLTTTAKIGIGNLSPTNQLDVSGNSKFVGVTTFAGITTVTGKTLFTKQLNVSGVSTFVGVVTTGNDLFVGGDIYIKNVNPMITFTEDDDNPDYRIIQNGGKLAIQDIQDGTAERFSINRLGRVTVNRDLDVDRNLEVTGVSTFTGAIDANGDIFVGTGATVGFGTTAYFRDNAAVVFGDDEDLILSHDGAQSILSEQGTGGFKILTSTFRVRNSDNSKQFIVANNGGIKLYNDGDEKLEIIGTGASVYNELKVASFNGGTSGLSSHFGSLRYGDASGGAPYSTRRSLDLINTDSGNINFYLNANNLSVPIGGSDFHWHKGINNTTLMTLTRTGRLGVGTTLPSTTLHVMGSATISGNVNLGGGITGDVIGNVTGDVTGDLTGNVFANSGVSTFKRLDLDTSSYYEFGELSAAGVGIGTTMGSFKLAVNDDADKKFIITDSGNVGIKTDGPNGNALLVNGAIAALDPIGIGTDEPRAAVDFADAGQATTGLAANRMYMIPPKVGAAQTAALAGLRSGAMIYNIDLNKLQLFDGSSWSSLGVQGNGFVNAADYGLDASKTDGTNVTAINNAIAALGKGGGTVFFPGGMFYLNAAIELTRAANENSLRFVGSGHQNYGGSVGVDTGGTVLRRDQDDEFFNITNSRAIHFIGITFKGGAANGSGGNSGISGGNGAIHVLANAGCQGYLIENCVFHGIANCITFKGLSDSIIRACRFRNVPSNEGAGALIKLDENGSEVIDQIRIQDCVLDGSPDGTALNANIDGIAIYNTVSTVYVTNTSAIRLKRSFYSDSSWDGNFFYFQNSEAERASSDGFSINGTGNFVTIDNCFSCTNSGHGINIGASQNSSLNITNPNVRDNAGHGILIDGPTNNCSIVNPAIGGNSKGSTGTNHGIVIGTNANNVYISGGKIGGNTAELAGTGDQGRGILINGTAHDNIRIIGANVTGNQNAEGISQSISSGTGNSIQFNAGSTVALDT